MVTSSRIIGIGMTSQRTRTRMIERLRLHGIVDEVVLDAMSKTPRHLFVDEALASRAYEETALPIGFGQTISNPLTVAYMLAMVREQSPYPIKRALEIGTGCGYQAAVMSHFCEEVFSVERIANLAIKATHCLKQLNYTNVNVLHADGHYGWMHEAPFDAIVVAAAAREVPSELLMQLAPDGKMILPITNSASNRHQQLHLIHKKRTGMIEQLELKSVHFVPLLNGKVE